MDFKLGIDNSKNGMYNVDYRRMIFMKWNEKVLKLMEQKGVTQKALSKMSGIAESSISRYLHSDSAPRLDVIINFAKALDVETEYLLDEQDKSESAYTSIATAVARKGNELTAEEKNRLIALILGTGNYCIEKVKSTID